MKIRIPVAVVIGCLVTMTCSKNNAVGSFFEIKNQQQEVDDSCRMVRNEIIDLVFSKDSQFQVQYEKGEHAKRKIFIVPDALLDTSIIKRSIH